MMATKEGMTMPEETNDAMTVDQIHAMPIDDMKEWLGALTPAQLTTLRDMETDAGVDKARKGALAAIDAELAKLETASDEADASDATPADAPADGPPADGGELEKLAVGMESLGYPTTSEDGAGVVDMALATMTKLHADMIAMASDNEVLTTHIVALEQQLRDAGAPNPGPDPVVIPQATQAAGPALKLYDGHDAIEAAGVLTTDLREWGVVGGVATFNRKIDISSDLPRVTITHVRTVDDRGDVLAECEIPGGLRAGAGVHAELPAGSLAFRPVAD